MQIQEALGKSAEQIRRLGSMTAAKRNQTPWSNLIVEATASCAIALVFPAVPH